MDGLGIPVPRSNIYKYAALSGVLIIVVALIVTISHVIRTSDEIMAAEERIEITTAGLEAGKRPQGGEPETDLQRSIDRIRLESARKRLDLLEARSLALREWAVILFTLGFILAVFGFTQWYRKIQIPMEQIARSSADQYANRPDSEESRRRPQD